MAEVIDCAATTATYSVCNNLIDGLIDLIVGLQVRLVSYSWVCLPDDTLPQETYELHCSSVFGNLSNDRISHRNSPFQIYNTIPQRIKACA